MQRSIKVSVVVPVYNVLEYLRTCLDTLANQSMQECEFILVSDGASEEECSICNEYVAKDSRFKFFRRKHAGVSATRNYGVAQARGEYITFVDSDDWIGSNILKEAYEQTKKMNCDVTFWNYVLAYNKRMEPVRFSTMDECVLSEDVLKSIKENLFFVRKLNYSIFANPWGKLYRTSLVKEIPFDEDLPIGSDRIFNLQVFARKVRVSYLNREAYFYRQNNCSITNRYRPNAYEIFLKYVRRLSDLSNGAYRGEICNEFLHKFEESLSRDYFHKENPLLFKENVNRLKRVFKSREFRKAIEYCNFSKLNLIHKIDYVFIRAKIFPWLYIRTVLLSLKKRLT